MKKILAIREENGQSVVSARELYDFLEVKTAFTDWMKRQLEYGFEENVDYSPLKIGRRSAHNKKDYALSINCAKEISMLQRTDKGKEARKYFIECENKLQKAQALVSSMQEEVTPELMILRSITYLQQTVEQQQLQLMKQAPKVDYVDKILSSGTEHSITTIAKELGISGMKLNNILHQKGVQFKQNNVWVLYAKYQNRGYTKARTHLFIDKFGETKTSVLTYWTERGRAFIHYIFREQQVA